jgi:hypothetical protein
MQDRRRHPRIEEERRVTIYLVPEHPEPDGQPVMISGVTRDFSGDGLVVKTYTPLTTGAFLRVDIPVSTSPPRHSVSLSGMVRWSSVVPGESKHLAGIEFFDIPDPDRQSWSRHVADLLR